MVRIILILSCLLMSALMSGFSEPPEESGAHDAIISEYVQAYNNHNIVGMQALMHENIEWIDVSGSGQSIVTSSKVELVEALESYFNGTADSTSELVNWSINGRYVSVTEIVSWTASSGEKKSQASISVYEMEDGLIRRVWYFPAQSR